MKGMLNFLERAGLLKKDPVAEPAQALSDGTRSTNSADSADNINRSVTDPGTAAPAASTKAASSTDEGQPLNLDEIYANSHITPSLYPAERLLRLVDGLSAMDEATRLMAIKAMDAADESWSIDDPLADAAAKVKALVAYAQARQLSLQALQAESQTRLEAVAARQAQVVGDIRKQITELEALASRELSRAAQETATQEASLKAAQDQTARELNEIARVSQRLQGLAVQFGTPTTPQE